MEVYGIRGLLVMVWVLASVGAASAWGQTCPERTYITRADFAGEFRVNLNTGQGGEVYGAHQPPGPRKPVEALRVGQNRPGNAERARWEKTIFAAIEAELMRTVSAGHGRDLLPHMQKE